VWPSVPPTATFRRPPSELPFPLAQPGCRLYARARHGLWRGARQLGLGAGDEVLAPAFHHGSEIEALLKTGAHVRFYDCDELLRPEPDGLQSLMGPRVRALHLVHYLGFPQDSRRWRRWCDERGLLLFEDCAQSWLARAANAPVGSFGQLAIFCLYKMAGLGQPGAMVCDAPPPPVRGRKPAGVGDVAAAHASWAMQRLDLRRVAGQRTHAPFVPDSRSEFDLGDPESGPARAPTFLARRLGREEVAERRRANYRLLRERLGGLVAPAFRELPPGASPLQFPVVVSDKPRFLERLAARGIEGADAWPVAHPSLPVRNFPSAAALRSTLVGLPVHHGLRDSDLDRVATAALRAQG
jgi:dTDP-4-amino-4,6-dideoxygalactose transaminase